jgi:hypothetical protein
MFFSCWRGIQAVSVRVARHSSRAELGSRYGVLVQLGLSIVDTAPTR